MKCDGEASATYVICTSGRPTKYFTVSHSKDVEQELDTVSDALDTSHHTTIHVVYNGSPPNTLSRLPRRLPSHRTGSTPPSIPTDHQTHPTPPTTSSINNTPSSCTPTHTELTIRHLGWHTQRRTEEENITHEKATPAISEWKAFERRHSVE